MKEALYSIKDNYCYFGVIQTVCADVIGIRKNCRDNIKSIHGVITMSLSHINFITNMLCIII